MSNLNELMKGLVRTAGTAGVNELNDALGKIESEAKEPWKRALLNLTGEAVEKYGLDGVRHVERLVDKIGDDGAHDLEFASLKARSDYLAALQNMEADEKSKAKDFFSTIGKTLGTILKAVIGGLAGR